MSNAHNVTTTPIPGRLCHEIVECSCGYKAHFWVPGDAPTKPADQHLIDSGAALPERTQS